MILDLSCPTCGYHRRPHNLALVHSWVTYCKCPRPAKRKVLLGIRRENGVIVIGDFIDYDAWSLAIEMGERDDRRLNAPGV